MTLDGVAPDTFAYNMVLDLLKDMSCWQQVCRTARTFADQPCCIFLRRAIT